MSTFDDRETAFEAKFAHDAEMQFKAMADATNCWGYGRQTCLAKPVKTHKTMPVTS